MLRCMSSFDEGSSRRWTSFLLLLSISCLLCCWDYL